MMRHTYITANRTLSAEEHNVMLAWRPRTRGTWFGCPEGGTERPREPRNVAFTNLLSRTPLRGPRADFRGRRGAPDHQGSRHEGRDRRRGVPKRRPREHDHCDVPHHNVADRSGDSARVTGLPVHLDDLREQAEVPRPRVRVPEGEGRDLHLRDAAPDEHPSTGRLRPHEVGEGPRMPADRAPRGPARGTRCPPHR